MGLFNLEKAFHDELTGKIMVVAIILLFLVTAFVIFLHLYAKWYLYRRQEQEQPPPSSTTTVVIRRRRRLHFAPGSVTAHRRGLDPSVLKSIPILSFDPVNLEKGLECAVCLSELEEGEKFRSLPKCHHGFHVDCIDMWFQSHSTCPLCRNPISNPINPISPKPSEQQQQQQINLDSILQSTRADNAAFFPTNVLFWGNNTRVLTRTLSSHFEEDDDHHRLGASSVIAGPSPSSSSSSGSNGGDGMLVIDIPRQFVEDEESSSSSSTPVTTRLRSLKRLLSRDKRVNPCSPIGGGDTEQ